MDMPFYLKKYDPDILKSLKVKDIDIEKGTFTYTIVFYDPTDDIHKADETGLVKKSGTGTGTFTWEAGLPEKEAECDDDRYPEIDRISFGGLAVSDDIWLYVHNEIEERLTNED